MNNTIIIFRRLYNIIDLKWIRIWFSIYKTQNAQHEGIERLPHVFHKKANPLKSRYKFPKKLTQTYKIINIYDTQHIRLPVITAYLQTSKEIDNDPTYISGTGRPSTRKRPPLSHNLIFHRRSSISSSILSLLDEENTLGERFVFSR